jgi:hypothetical protein
MHSYWLYPYPSINAKIHEIYIYIIQAWRRQVRVYTATTAGGGGGGGRPCVLLHYCRGMCEGRGHKRIKACTSGISSLYAQLFPIGQALYIFVKVPPKTISLWSITDSLDQKLFVEDFYDIIVCTVHTYCKSFAKFNITLTWNFYYLLRLPLGFPWILTKLILNVLQIFLAYVQICTKKVI